MTQLQFEITLKLIQNGAPALANELCGALNDLVNERNILAEENEKFKRNAMRINEPVKENPEILD